MRMSGFTRYILNITLYLPYCHREKWDGSGYLRGLKTGTIPLAIRMTVLPGKCESLHS